MRNAPWSGLRPYWVTVLATSIAVFLVAYWAGWVRGWLSFSLLACFTIVAWVLDPLILAIGVGIVGAASLFVSHRFPIAPGVLPHPLVVVLTAALVHFGRIEIAMREDLLAKKAELRARQSEQEEFRTFFENSPTAIVTADGEGRIILSNPAAQKLLGDDEHPIRGQGIAQSVAALGAALRIDRNKTLFHNLTGCTGWRPNGEMFVADAWFSIAETPAGTRLGAVVVDATERLQERARGGLRSSMATSQIAMGAVLHEIRNLSAAAALMYNNLTHADTAFLPGFQGNADFEALGSLLKALTGLAAAELRPGEGSYASVSLADALAQLRIIIDPWFQESEMAIKWDIDPDLPQVWGEESGLLQLFLNLAQNSHKAMLTLDNGHLTIEARLENEWVVVRFADSGPGVGNPTELFEPFRRSTGVKGLGLFVSRAIAHSFHGDLKHTPVESGSCFTVELLPLREWQKVIGGDERSPIHD